MNLASSIAIKSIEFYQKELSHRKKYCCAHGVLHQGLTCSEYSKQKIEKYGIFQGVKETILRLKECYLASKKIKEIRSELAISDNGLSEDKTNNDSEIDPCLIAQLSADSACCILTLWPF